MFKKLNFVKNNGILNLSIRNKVRPASQLVRTRRRPATVSQGQERCAATAQHGRRDPSLAESGARPRPESRLPARRRRSPRGRHRRWPS